MENKTLKEIEDIIYKKKLFFKVLTNDPKNPKKFGDFRTLDEVQAGYGSFEAFVNKLTSANGMKEIRFETKLKNGSSKRPFGFFLAKIEPVEKVATHVEKVDNEPTNATNTATKSTSVTEYTTNQPVTEHTRNVEKIDLTVKPKMEDFKAHIENAKMGERIIQLEKDNANLNEKNKKLDHKNEELFTEVMKLNRELSTGGSKTDIEIQKKEVEHERALLNLEKDSKGSLAGILDEIKGNPELLGTIISVFQPNNPIVKAQADKIRGEGSSNGPDLSGNTHEDPETQKFIKDVYDLLVSQPREEVGKIGAIVGLLTEHHEKIQPVLDYLGRKGSVKPETHQEATIDDDDEND